MSSKTKIELTEYDPVNYMDSPESMTAYLDAFLTDMPDDTAAFVAAIGDVARAKGMTQVAQEAGLKREGLYRSLSGNRDPGFATVMKVLGSLGLSLQVVSLEPASESR